MTLPVIPFNQPFLTGQEEHYLKEVLAARMRPEASSFTERCEALLAESTGAARVLLTHSCTNALELAAALLVSPGDEVIMPAFTFTSTANAFLLHGALPVFVDSCPETLNIDPRQVEQAITSRTRAIVAMHYAGVACDMTQLLAIADRHGLTVIEDAAQAVGATFRDRALGTLGQLGTYSFHHTKNIACGEGGALLVNDPSLIRRAEILHDKGTTRAQFRAGLIRQYSWVDLGMSAPPTEFQAAALLAQLQQQEAITQQRRAIWDRYQHALSPLAARQRFRLPGTRPDSQHNAHIYRLQLPDTEERDAAQAALLARGIQAALHYQPLHRSEAGLRLCRIGSPDGRLPVVEALASRLLRLPIYPDLPEQVPELVADILNDQPERTGDAACYE